MLQILYKDHHYVAINKPSGLLVHRSEIDRHETRFAVQLLRDQLGQHVYPIHRLDKPTSGVLVFALSADAARKMAAAFESHLISKHYLAIVRGYLQETMRIDHPLKYHEDDYADRNRSSLPQTLPAITAVEPIATAELPFAFGKYSSMRFSLIHARPETGRKHQIRRHLKHISHPIIGDANHGKGDLNRWIANQYQCPRLMLASTRLEFMHPYEQRTIVIDARVDRDFQHLANELGWRERIPADWREVM